VSTVLPSPDQYEYSEYSESSGYTIRIISPPDQSASHRTHSCRGVRVGAAESHRPTSDTGLRYACTRSCQSAPLCPSPLQ
jgi:hypothetical protein